jgi:hypothetical protein
MSSPLFSDGAVLVVIATVLTLLALMARGVIGGKGYDYFLVGILTKITKSQAPWRQVIFCGCLLGLGCVVIAAGSLSGKSSQAAGVVLRGLIAMIPIAVAIAVVSGRANRR